jgi:hypothetical protein
MYVDPPPTKSKNKKAATAAAPSKVKLQKVNASDVNGFLIPSVLPDLVLFQTKVFRVYKYQKFRGILTSYLSYDHEKLCGAVAGDSGTGCGAQGGGDQ